LSNDRIEAATLVRTVPLFFERLGVGRRVIAGREREIVRPILLFQVFDIIFGEGLYR